MGKLIGLLVLGAIVSATGASAHHSFAMFDRTKPMTITGTIKQFEWTNPHSWLHVMGSAGVEPAKEWAIEMTSPNVLLRQGWKPKTLKPGDRISVDIYPLRDGSAGGSFVKAKTLDGRSLSQEAGIMPAK